MCTFPGVAFLRVIRSHDPKTPVFEKERPRREAVKVLAQPMKTSGPTCQETATSGPNQAMPKGNKRDQSSTSRVHRQEHA